MEELGKVLKCVQLHAPFGLLRLLHWVAEMQQVDFCQVGKLRSCVTYTASMLQIVNKLSNKDFVGMRTSSRNNHIEVHGCGLSMDSRVPDGWTTSYWMTGAALFTPVSKPALWAVV